MNKDELRAFLIRHRLTPEQFAKLLGVTYMAVDHWLRGRRAVSLTVKRLCELFDRHPDLVGEFAHAG